MTILHSKGLTDEDDSTNLETGFHLNNLQLNQDLGLICPTLKYMYALKKNYAIFLPTFQQYCLEEKKKKKGMWRTIIQILYRPVNSS